MKELKIKRGMFIVLDHEKNEKLQFDTLEEAETYVNGVEPAVAKDVKEIEEDPFDFTKDDNLTF